MTDLLIETEVGTSSSLAAPTLPPAEPAPSTSSSIKAPPVTVTEGNPPRRKPTDEEINETIRTLERNFKIYRTQAAAKSDRRLDLREAFLVWLWKEGSQEIFKLFGIKLSKVQRKNGKRIVYRKKVNQKPWSIKENYALVSHVHLCKDRLESIDWTRISRLLTMKAVAERFRPKDFLSPENCSEQYKLLVEVYGQILPEQDMRETIGDRLHRYFDGEYCKIAEQENVAMKLRVNKLTKSIKDLKYRCTTELMSTLFDELMVEMREVLSDEEVEIDDDPQPQPSMTKPTSNKTKECEETNFGDAKTVNAGDVAVHQDHETAVKAEPPKIDIVLPMDNDEKEDIKIDETMEVDPGLPIQQQPVRSPDKATGTSLDNENLIEDVEQEPNIAANDETEPVSIQAHIPEPPEEIDIKPDLDELNLLIANSVEAANSADNAVDMLASSQKPENHQPSNADKDIVTVDKPESESTTLVLQPHLKPVVPIPTVEEIVQPDEIEKLDKSEVEKTAEPVKVNPAKETKGRVDTKLKVEITPLPDILIKKEVHDTSLVKETDLGTPTSSSPALSEKSVKVEEQNKLFKRSILLLHGRITGHKHASLFHKPVRKESAPQYYKWIKQPVDLATIKRRIETGEISTMSRYERDLSLMFLNAVMYNANNPDITEITLQMEKDAREIVKDHKTTQQLLQLNYDSDETQSSRQTRRRNSSVHTEQVQKPKRTRTTSKLVTSEKPTRKSTSSGVEETWSSPGPAIVVDPSHDDEDDTMDNASEKKHGKPEKKTKGKRRPSTLEEDSPQREQPSSTQSNSSKRLSVKIGRTTRRTAGTP